MNFEVRRHHVAARRSLTLGAYNQSRVAASRVRGLQNLATGARIR